MIVLPPVEPIQSINQHGTVDWGHAITQAGIIGVGTAAIVAIRGTAGSLVLTAAGIGAIAGFASFVVRDLLRSRRT